MDAQVRAGIDLYGKGLRYAAVEQYGRQHHLLRLGRCDFDFDVTEALLGTGAPEQLKAITEALTEVYDGSAAQSLRVVVHPTHGPSFSAPAPAGEDEAARRERFRREVALLTRDGDLSRKAHSQEAHSEVSEVQQAEIHQQAEIQETKAAEGAATGEAPSSPKPSSEPFHLTTERLYAETRAGEDGAEEQVEWFHVLALPEAAHERFERVLASLPLSEDFAWTVSTRAAARAADVLMHRRGDAPAAASSTEAPPYTLVVGQYPEHVELALSRDGGRHLGVHAPTSAPPDSAYYTAALLDQLGESPEAVGRVFLYSMQADPTAFSLLERLVSSAPEPFDVRPLVDLDPESLADDFEPGAYVPCIGAAL